MISSENINIRSFQDIIRPDGIKGKLLPVFICNGGIHYHTKLEVYEDGLIDAWEVMDIETFKSKVYSGFITPYQPDASDLRIHHVGSWKLKECQWRYDKDSFINYIISIINSLHDGFSPKYKIPHTSKVTASTFTTVQLAYGRPFIGIMEGEYASAFLRVSADIYYHITLSVFPDSTILISSLPSSEQISFDELKRQIIIGRICTSIPDASVVCIYGLGHCTVSQCHNHIPVSEILLQIEDIISVFNGSEGSSERCARLFQQYRYQPDESLKTILADAYHDVPDHMKRYILGDPAMRDEPIMEVLGLHPISTINLFNF